MADKLGYPRVIIEHKEGRERAMRRIQESRGSLTLPLFAGIPQNANNAFVDIERTSNLVTLTFT